MQTLAFDGRMGASGDMLLGALLAAGADRDVLDPVEAALDIEYRIERVRKNGIRATSVDVFLTGEDEKRKNDEHEHGHGHGHDHKHEHSHAHAEGHGPTRTYSEVLAVLERMDLPDGVEADARATFRLLAEAEADVHGTDIEGTAFHEVGADDAIADVVGVAVLLADLGVEHVVTTPVSAGGGEVAMSHGSYPVPTPAVVNLAREASWEMKGGPVEMELLTPTGAALLAYFAEGVDSFPPLRVAATGYGAGGYTFEDRPNVLRATVGESRGGLNRGEVRVLETNLDDAAPELLGGLHKRLKAAGARDVTILPASMKKSRPGHLVKVIVKPADVQRVARALAEETGTLGVRETATEHRWIAERQFETVEVEIDGTSHEVTVKLASDDAGEVYDVSAEYDDCEAVARQVDIPTREVMRRAETALRNDWVG